MTVPPAGDHVSSGASRVPAPEEEIVCVDCGGPCHLLTHEPETGWVAGQWVAYRCRDCLDRWDLVLG